MAASILNDFYASGMRIPARGVAALGVARRFDYLLLSAAALPILEKCAVIPVYRQSLQCGERSKAAFRRQSAARQTSLAPHGVRRGCNTSRFAEDSWRSHVHRTNIAQRVQSFKLQTANVGGRGELPSRSLWGLRGPFSHVREWPPLSAPLRGAGE